MTENIQILDVLAKFWTITALKLSLGVYETRVFRNLKPFNLPFQKNDQIRMNFQRGFSAHKLNMYSK